MRLILCVECGQPVTDPKWRNQARCNDCIAREQTRKHNDELARQDFMRRLEQEQREHERIARVTAEKRQEEQRRKKEAKAKAAQKRREDNGVYLQPTADLCRHCIWSDYVGGEERLRWRRPLVGEKCYEKQQNWFCMYPYCVRLNRPNPVADRRAKELLAWAERGYTGPHPLAAKAEERGGAE